jgi:neutral ceramidase
MSVNTATGRGVALLLVLAIAAFASPVAAQLRAGAGKAEIELGPDLLPMQGFSAQRDPLQARVLVVEAGDRRAALAVVDLTSIFADEVAVMQGVVAEATGVPPANVLVVASHTFSAPHIMPAGRPFPGLESEVEQRKNTLFKIRVESALKQAALTASHLKPAKLGVGRGVSDINVNRDQHTPEGFWLGVDSAGPSDKTLSVVRIEDGDRHPIALLANYAVQPSVMDQAIISGGGKAVTSDLAGAAMRRVEGLYGEGTVALFLIGAAGDQAPILKARRAVPDKNGRLTTVDIGERGYLLVDLLGERLAQDIVRASERMAPPTDTTLVDVANGAVDLVAQERPKAFQDLKPSKTYAFTPTGPTTAPFTVLRLGAVAIVGVQVELSSETGRQIKAQSPFADTLVATMVNGAAKYMPDAAAYDKITYEAMNSSFARGSAETLVTEMTARLRRSAAARPATE